MYTKINTPTALPCVKDTLLVRPNKNYIHHHQYEEVLNAFPIVFSPPTHITTNITI